MPSHDTFSVPPIGEFVRSYLRASKISIDPFARNKRWTTHTNDLNPETEAEHHMDAEAFLLMLGAQGVKADLVIFDPPYSPRQISECYKAIGLEVGMKETQSALLYQRVRNAIIPVLAPGGIVLSFGWNTVGMGKKHGFEIIEIQLCCHGGAHNDTICMAEEKLPEEQEMFGFEECVSGLPKGEAVASNCVLGHFRR
ncbi:hypothetical protein UFOVP83_52 [uncultured Caudovirales phage]|uniref:Uncharacterized protein n=1 Tax=uncultured Caudovirales phage TaxID=2100421 RepID=A0A6J5TCS0_9CAUD|nr:hypothetical protein UFOVP83_52 [uncultured Caudovirales phage]